MAEDLSTVPTKRNSAIETAMRSTSRNSILGRLGIMHDNESQKSPIDKL